jgi:hypothetical protein
MTELRVLCCYERLDVEYLNGHQLGSPGCFIDNVVVLRYQLYLCCPQLRGKTHLVPVYRHHLPGCITPQAPT